MTTDEAIEAFKKIHSVKEHIEIHEALNMAIHALELQKTYENIINVTSDSCSQRGCNKCDEYRKALEHQKWIDTTIRLPEYKTNPITGNDLTYPVTCRFGKVYDVRYYEFYNGHWYDASPDIMDRYVIAWMERPEPYREEQN